MCLLAYNDPIIDNIFYQKLRDPYQQDHEYLYN